MNNAFTLLRVIRKQAIAQDIIWFELAHPDQQPLPTFTPGAHLTVQTPGGDRRSYSLCGNPNNTATWQIAVKRDANGRGGSVSMVDDVQSGDLLTTSSWSNLFELKQHTGPNLFVAGGIGITPIMSMIHHLQDIGQTNFKLIYCTRNPEATAFMQELQTNELKDQVIIHHDDGDASQAFDFWPVFERPTRAHVYCCGPQGLMDSVRDMTGHWPNEQIHFESFGAGLNTTSENRAFDVVLQQSSKRVTVSAQQSILQALRDGGHTVASSCESGTCGSCRTKLISGEAEHRDWVLRPDEQAHHIMVCVSRAKSAELVLDL